jgi:uncharacterized membrane protein
MVVTFFVLLSILYYATVGYRLVDRDINKKSILILKRILLIGSFMMAVVAVSSYFFPPAAILLYVPAAFFIIATIYASHRPRKTKTIKKT